MTTRFTRGAACLVGAAFCFAAFAVWSKLSHGYLQNYMTFQPSFGELALRLNLLLFVLPATALLAVAFGELRRAPNEGLAWFDMDGVRSGPWRSAALALLVLGLTATIRWSVLELSPITDDEHVYNFQARILESGHLYADSVPSPVRAFFDNQFIVNNGRWFGCYFLGHPAVLALAHLIGMDQWVGPIEAALTLLLAVGIARRIFGERTAVLCGILLALSPFFLFLSATQLSQPTSSLMLSLFWYSALRVESAPRSVLWWAIAACALSFGVLVRPQSMVVLSLPFIARLTILIARRQLRPGWVPPAVALGILAAGATAFLWIDYALTGNPLRTGYHAYMAQGNEWLFPFGPIYTMREISRNLAHINFWLFGWPVSLAFLPFFRRNSTAWTLAAVPIAAVLWYGLVAVPTVAAVGPVYCGEIIVPLVILSGSGIERAVTFARMRLGDSLWTRALIAWPWTGFLFSLLAFVPVQIASLRLSAEIVKAPYDLVERQHLDNAIVFVHSIPSLVKPPGSWVHFHRNNSPDLSDRVLFVKDLGLERNKELMRYLPTRAAYLLGMRGGDLVLIRLPSPS